MNSHQVNLNVGAAQRPTEHAIEEPGERAFNDRAFNERELGDRGLGGRACFEKECFRQSGFDRGRIVKAICMGALVLLATATFAMAPAAATERYRVMAMNPAFDDPANMRRMVSASKNYAFAESIEKFADEGYARAYYLHYLPARITQDVSMDEISDLMTTIRKRVSRSNRTGKPGARNIMGWLYKGMRPIAEGDYRPAARINAILLISRLDVVPADLMEKKPPVPSSVVPSVLLPIYQDAANSDGVRAAALKGLNRYASLAADRLQAPEQKTLRDSLVQEMQTLLTDKSPEGRDAAAHAYLQRFAIDILAAMQASADQDRDDKKRKNGFGAQLVSISTDKSSHRLLAMHAASRLGTVRENLIGGKGASRKILASWTTLVAQAFDSEIDRLESMTRPPVAARQPRSPDAMAQAARRARPANGRGRMANRARAGQQDPRHNNPMRNDPADGMDPTDGMMEDFPGGEMPGGMGRPSQFAVQPPEIVMSRRKLSFVVQQLNYGATGSRKRALLAQRRGLMAAVASEDQVVVRDWLRGLHQILDSINRDSLSTRASYLDELKSQSAKLQQLSRALSPPADAVKPAAAGQPNAAAPIPPADSGAAPMAWMAEPASRQTDV
ncbi:hypothetical protein [Planctomycetes bacterium K23_9]|uniref:Uncharacterized protein n=1 Tax=Stieleria marina TaxID=1930275 RepID=A0A517NYX1_9BACT|nr:hypothetical protein K239x_43410 [Planctomycetes bacterium K23_9]